MTKMKTTIELAKECGMEKLYSTIITNDETLEAFRLAVEAEFVSRLVLVGYSNKLDKGVDNASFNVCNKWDKLNLGSVEHCTENVYTLPKETK